MRSADPWSPRSAKDCASLIDAQIRARQGRAGAVADGSGAPDGVADSADGLMHNIAGCYEEIAGRVDSRREREESSLDLMRQRLIRKYARLEQLLSRLQGQAAWGSHTAAGEGGP